jgi:surface polysaccharide O-acyltransferase-like enzyme
MLLSIYLLFPILRVAFDENVKSFQYGYFLIIWFLFFSFIPLCLRFAGIEIPSIWFLRENIIFFLGYFSLAFSGYFVLGYYLENVRMETAKKKIIYWLSVVSFFVTVLGTYFLTMKNGGNLDNYLYSELSPNIIVMSIGLFVWFRDIDWAKILNKRLLSGLEGFGLICYGIYLSHPFILDQLRAFKMFKGISFEWSFLAVFCLIISYVFCLIISRVKILKNLLISYTYQGKSTIRKD